MKTAHRKPPVSQKTQFIAGFIIPTIILLTLSDESKLGPLVSMVLSLAFPTAIELYALLTGRKQSIISLFAIIGILLIGAISLLGLSEEWLGVRRAGIYLIGAVAVASVLRFRRSLVDKALERLIDIAAVRKAAHKNKTEKRLARHITKTGYLLVVLLLLLAVWNYVLTLLVITAPTGSSEFNAEYARLRVLSIPAVTLPFLVGMVGLMFYLLTGFEKLTGIGADRLLNKKR